MHHNQSYAYHWILHGTSFQTHTTIKHILKFEIHSPGDDSAGIGVLVLRFPQTDAVETCGRWMLRSGSIAIAPNAPNRNSPWMMQTWTVEFWCEFDDEIQKQMEMMMKQDQHNKNFRIWARIEEVLVNLAFWCSWRIWENSKNLRSDFGKCVFCYD